MQRMHSKPHYFHVRWIAWLLRVVLHYRRDVVMINLSRSFPDRKYGELAGICKDFYRHLATVMVEALWFGRCSYDKLTKSRIAQVSNPEVLDRMYELAPSTIILQGHFGNWEMSGGIQSFLEPHPSPATEKNICVIHKALSNKRWEGFFRRNRTAPLHDPEHYEGYIESGSVLRYIYEHRDEKRFYVLIADQSPYTDTDKNLTIDFLNQRTKVMTPAAAIARKLGLAVVYSGMMRREDGSYTIKYTPICEDASKMSVEDITKRFYSLLEADINAQPESYLWSHKRWKMQA